MTTRGWNEAWLPLFDNLARMRKAWPTRGWCWDARLACVTSSFTVDQEPDARRAVALALSTEWTSTTIARAPVHLREGGDPAGGVRQGQLVLSSVPTDGLRRLALWWAAGV